MVCGGSALFYPKPPGGGGGQSNSNHGTVVHDGRIRPRRRNPFFSDRLHRASQLIQNPTHITFREACIFFWALYAAYKLFLASPIAWNLLAVADVSAVCRNGQSFLGCGRDLFWAEMFFLYLYLAEVVPWAILCAAVVFVGEEVMRRR